MRGWMLRLAMVAGLGLAFASAGALAKAPWTKATGMKCAECHDGEKPKTEPSDNGMYKKALAHKAKGACVDCHAGARKPAPKP